MSRVACIVVTYKKPKDLAKCIEGIKIQSLEPDMLIVVDNFSQDETSSLCVEVLNLEKKALANFDHGSLFQGSIGNIKAYYFQKYTNDGGSGGFSDGIDIALRHTNADRLWLMDDDGVPEKDCLKQLSIRFKENTVLNPIVLDIDNPEQCSFLKDKYGQPLKYSDIIAKNLFVEVNPFNGTFLPVGIIKDYGNVKKDMFIWGDEMEFIYRMRSSDVIFKTVLKAIHFHPKNKKNEILSLPMNLYIRSIKNKYFEYVYYRNRVWNDLNYSNSLNRRLHLIRSIIDAILNSFYHLFNAKWKRAKWILIAILHGISSNFSLKIHDFNKE